MNQPAHEDFSVPSRAALAPSLSQRSQNGRVLEVACGVSSLAGCLCLLYVIPMLGGAWALSPKARAGCGKPARRDRWRGS
jgi:hypothetical protein